MNQLKQATAEQLLPKQREEFAVYDRLVADTETWLAETLNGSMRTSFVYRYYNGELYGEDGGALGEIFDDAISEAKVITEENPSMLFELRRRIIEKGEYEDMLAMSREELPNTMVVVSDFPPELMDEKEDVGGYNAGRKQTMLRVITRQPNGEIVMRTQSLDGSDRQALEDLYSSLGFSAEEGELLEQRKYLDLPEAWQGRLIDNLTETYDNSMAEQNGGDWHAGIKQTSSRQTADTYGFVQRQVDLTDWFIREKQLDPIGAEKLRYQLAATMEQRYEAFVNRPKTDEQSSHSLGFRNYCIVMPSVEQLHFEMQQALAVARSSGRVFSGCGASVGAEQSVEDQLNQSGYGNKTIESTKYSFDKKTYCVSCQKSPKKGEPKKQCGPCSLCRSCDKAAGGKG